MTLDFLVNNVIHVGSSLINVDFLRRRVCHGYMVPLGVHSSLAKIMNPLLHDIADSDDIKSGGTVTTD